MFVGWDKEVATICTGNAEYVAKYQETAGCDCIASIYNSSDGIGIVLMFAVTMLCGLVVGHSIREKINYKKNNRG